MQSDMKSDPTKLPDNCTFSKDEVDSIVNSYQEKIHYLEERIRLLQNELFGRKSEKRYPDDHRQLPIFDQPIDELSPDEGGTQKTIVIAEHQRTKRGRKPLPDDLPRIDVIHDIAEEEKVCACGTHLTRIGQDSCEKRKRQFNPFFTREPGGVMMREKFHMEVHHDRRWGFGFIQGR